MILIAIACMLEASPFLTHFSLKKTQNSPFPLYERESLALVVTGIGEHAMIAALSHTVGSLAKNSYVVNIGYAGHRSAPLGAVYSVNSILKEGAKSAFYPHISGKSTLPSMPLRSVTQPESLFSEELLYDMEGHAFFETAKRFVPLEQIILWKVVSDGPKRPFERSPVSTERALPVLLPHSETLPPLSCPKEPTFPPSWRLTHTQRLQAARSIRFANELGVDLAPCYRAKTGRAFLRALQEITETTLPEYA